MEIKKFTLRIPIELAARIDHHTETKGVKVNHFGNKALEAALDAEGVPKVVKPRRRKPAQSA